MDSIKLINLIGMFVIAGVINVAHAHDPAAHANEPEEPNCEAMQSMQHSGDKSDPVYLAMMMNCDNAATKAPGADPAHHAGQDMPAATNDDNEHYNHQH